MKPFYDEKFDRYAVCANIRERFPEQIHVGQEYHLLSRYCDGEDIYTHVYEKSDFSEKFVGTLKINHFDIPN